MSLGREQSLWGRIWPGGTEPGGGEGGFGCKSLAKGGPSGEEGKGSSWEDVRKAGDSYTPSLHLEFDISHSDEEEHCGLAGTE